MTNIFRNICSTFAYNVEQMSALFGRDWHAPLRIEVW